MTVIRSRGKMLSDRLTTSLRRLQRGPIGVDRNRQIIWGITHYGLFVQEMTMEAFLEQASRVLIDSSRVYRWEDTLVHEFREPDNERLLVLATPAKAEPCAAGW